MPSLLLITDSLLLGLGLSMDAFSVSAVRGMAAPSMPFSARARVAAVFAFFQALMPLIGWACVSGMIRGFSALARFTPLIALVLLLFLGIRMIAESRKPEEPKQQSLLLEGIATSIDALSVGFTIASYPLGSALLCAGLIAAVTFPVCLLGVRLGAAFGKRVGMRAMLLGGVILIVIGVQVFLTGFFQT